MGNGSWCHRTVVEGGRPVLMCNSLRDINMVHVMEKRLNDRLNRA